MTDEHLLGRTFGGPTWATGRVLAKALFALPMTASELEVYRRHTGREHPPMSPVSEGWIVAGRRGGKTLLSAGVAVFLAAFRDYSGHLGPGEVATVALIASDRRQARVLFRYCLGLLEGAP